LKTYYRKNTFSIEEAVTLTQFARSLRLPQILKIKYQTKKTQHSETKAKKTKSEQQKGKSEITEVERNLTKGHLLIKASLSIIFNI
jgi:hypothetical protein